MAFEHSAVRAAPYPDGEVGRTAADHVMHRVIVDPAHVAVMAEKRFEASPKVLFLPIEFDWLVVGARRESVFWELDKVLHPVSVVFEALDLVEREALPLPDLYGFIPRWRGQLVIAELNAARDDGVMCGGAGNELKIDWFLAGLAHGDNLVETRLPGPLLEVFVDWGELMDDLLLDAGELQMGIEEHIGVEVVLT